MTDTLTREEVEAMLATLATTTMTKPDMFKLLTEQFPRLAAAYLALLDRHEEALGVIREVSEPAVLGASYRREWDKRIARAREFLQRVGGEE